MSWSPLPASSLKSMVGHGRSSGTRGACERILVHGMLFGLSGRGIAKLARCLVIGREVERRYCGLACSALACFRMSISWSASFQKREKIFIPTPKQQATFSFDVRHRARPTLIQWYL